MHETDRLQQCVTDLVLNSPLVRLFTENSFPRSALWVLFRDAFVYLIPTQTLFFDFVSGSNPFEAVPELARVAGISKVSYSSESQEPCVLHEPEPKEPGIPHNNPHQFRPSLLYLIEAVAFRLTASEKKDLEFTESLDPLFEAFADFLIWVKREKYSIAKLSALVSFVPVQSNLFSKLISFLGKVPFADCFFSRNHFERAILGFFASHLDSVFASTTIKKAFGLAKVLLQKLKATTTSRLLCPSEAHSKTISRAKLARMLSLKDFLVETQSLLFPRDSRNLQKLFLADVASLCSALFLKNQGRPEALWYHFDQELFFAQNKTVRNVDLINCKQQTIRMGLFAASVGEMDILEVKPEHFLDKGDLDAGQGLRREFERAFEQNLLIFEEGSVYRRLRLIVQSAELLHQSTGFQKLIEFLFANLVGWVPWASESTLESLERHFHLLLADCANLSAMINLLLEASNNLGPGSEILLQWISRSPNEKFLQVLIDKLSQVLTARASCENLISSFFSRENLLKVLDLEDSSQVCLIVRLIQQYEQLRMNDADQDTPGLSAFENSIQKSKLDFLTVLFFLRSELQSLLQSTTPNDAQDLLELGSHLVEPQDSLVKDQVRSSVLIFLLGSLQQKYNILDDPTSQFRKLLPQSQIFSHFQSLRLFSDNIRNHSFNKASGLSAKLNSILSEAKDGDSPGLSYISFYSLAVYFVNHYNTLGLVLAQHALLLERLKAQCSSTQKQFLQAIIENFPGSPGFSLKTPGKNWKPALVLLVINVTLSAMACQRGHWVLPRLLEDLLRGRVNQIPFNFKNIFVLDKATFESGKYEARLYECINCETPFTASNCNRLTNLSVCVGCKKEIGAIAYNKHNNNTREIFFEEYRKKMLLNDFYAVHEYLDSGSTVPGLSDFGFRVGHLLAHCLYAGLTAAGLVDCAGLLLANIEVSHPHLDLSPSDSMLYFCKHIEQDTLWLKKKLRLHESPLDFIGYMLQDILAGPSRDTSGKTVRQIQEFFALSIEKYRATLAEIQLQIKTERNRNASIEVVNENAIRRNVDFDEVRDGVDRFLFLNLRQTSKADLPALRGELETQPRDFQFLDFCLHNHVGTMRLTLRNSFRAALAKLFFRSSKWVSLCIPTLRPRSRASTARAPQSASSVEL